MLTPETLQQHITRHDKRLLEMAYGNSVAAASDRAGEIRGLLQVLLEVKTAWEHDRQRIVELERLEGVVFDLLVERDARQKRIEELESLLRRGRGFMRESRASARWSGEVNAALAGKQSDAT